MKTYRTALAVFLLGTSISVPLVASAEIGVFAAANQDLTGARPSENARPLFIQDRVVANERIASSTDGGGQILFLDQSSLTISPNSDIVLDKYVYDAEADTGELGLTVLKGAMRLVGGRITKKKPALIRTPSATIGIRGGMGSAVVGDDGVTRYMHIAGISSTISTDTEELTITREGGFAEIGQDGGIEYLGVAPEDFVNAAYSKRSTGRGEGGGEVRVEQTTEGVDDVEEIVSGDEDATDQGPISTSGEQQDDSSDEQTFETATNDADEESSNNFIEEIDVQVDQQIDGLFVFGKFDATIVADFDGNGTPGVQAVQEDFVLAFSLDQNQGLVLFSLPETGDDLSVDADVRADIAAVGLDSLVGRIGASSILDSPGLDGFLVSGFPLVGTGNGDQQISVDFGNASSDEFGAISGGAALDPGREGTEDVILIDRDDVPGPASVESFAGGAIQQVDMVIDGNRGINGDFDIRYDGNPEFTSLDSVTGIVDLQLQDGADFADDTNGTVDAIRVLIENDEFDGGPNPPSVDPNT